MMSPGDEIPLTKCPEQENLSTPKDPVPDITAAQQVQACTFPTTEQVLSSLSVVLNGGGLSQFGDIVHELNNVFAGRQDVITKLLPRLNRLVGDLNGQRNNIIRAMEGLDRLGDDELTEADDREGADRRPADSAAARRPAGPVQPTTLAPVVACRRRRTTS